MGDELRPAKGILASVHFSKSHENCWKYCTILSDVKDDKAPLVVQCNLCGSTISSASATRVTSHFFKNPATKAESKSAISLCTKLTAQVKATFEAQSNSKETKKAADASVAKSF